MLFLDDDSPEILLGTHREHGFEVSLPLEAFTKTHTHLLGSTGTGKTFFLAHLAQRFINEGYGVILLDGVGQAYELIRDQLFWNQYPVDRFDLVDPTSNRMPGINYLELVGDQNNTTPETWAPVVLQGLKKMFREGDERRVWLEKYGLMALIPLIRQGFTLMELGRFVSGVDPALREAILAREPNRDLARMWNEFARMKPSDQSERIGSTETRGDILALDAPPLQRLLGQKRTSIDWRRVMDESGVVLADCRRGGLLTNTGSEVLGTVLMDQIVRTAYDRPVGTSKPCFVIADEFQRFVSPDFSDALTALRNYGVYFVLSHQLLEHLDSVPTLRASVETNCKNKLVFSVSAADAEVLTDNLWAARSFPYYRVKKEIDRTYFEPRETTREVHSCGRAHADSLGAGSSEAFSYDTSPLIFGPVQSPFMGTGSSSMKGSVDIYSENKSVVPFHELIKRQELSSISFYSHEETRHWLRGSIIDQDQRECLAKIGPNPPVPLRTVEYERAPMSEELRQLRLGKLTAKYLTHQEIDVARRKRVPEFLQAQPQQHENRHEIFQPQPEEEDSDDGLSARQAATPTGAPAKLDRSRRDRS